jgi:ATP-dependent RNA helicase RhlE
MPPAIRELARGILRDPAEVAVAPVSSATETVSQGVFHIPVPQKIALLIHLLRDPAVERVIVFTRTKHGADKVVRKLEQVGIRGAAIHGNKSQNARQRALDGFRAGTIPVLVASDIAARGIDVDGISHVVNFDVPNEPETYVHRIGRTGRAGRSGTAWSLCGGEERAFISDIERLIRMRLPLLPLPATLPAVPAGPEPERGPRPFQRQGGGGRHGGPPRHGGGGGGGGGHHRSGHGQPQRREHGHGPRREGGQRPSRPVW